MYTKENFKKEMEEFVEKNKYSASEVGNCAYEIYAEHRGEASSELIRKILDIANMEAGPEFEMTEEEFMDFLEKM